MTTPAGQQAMIRHLLAMPNLPNVYVPNGDDVPLPRFVVLEGGSARGRTINDTTVDYPELRVLVETASGSGSSESNDLVSRLQLHFAPETRFEDVVIIESPDVRSPILEGGVYSVPVFIVGWRAY